MTLSPEAIVALFIAMFGAGWLGQFVTSRWGKEKRLRDVDVSKEYLSLASMSADEVEKRLNLIGKLSTDNYKLQGEVYLLQQKQIESEEKRKERDEQLEALQAQISALQAQIDVDARERADLRAKLADIDVKYRALWKYLIAQLELMKKHDVKPAPPPDELKDDPEIVRLLQEFDAMRTGNTGKFKAVK